MTEKLTMRVVQGVPNGCECHPTTYSGDCFTWALYEEERFYCSGKPFSSWLEAYQDGLDFCQRFPGEEPPSADQN